MNHLERLEKLREVMASAVKVEHGYVLDVGRGKMLFDINVWHSDEEEHIARAPECGTACCVAGTAAFVPEFESEGFRRSDHSVMFTDEFGDDLFDHEAFAAYFGLSLHEGKRITDPVNYRHEAGVTPGSLMRAIGVTPPMVVKRIDEAIVCLKARIAKSLKGQIHVQGQLGLP